jgi:hypothetical protein
MGALNEIFSNDRNEFSKIEQILKILLIRNKNKSKNTEVLNEIGLIKEYSYIKSQKFLNELISYTQKNKLIRNIINSSKQKENFIQWAKFLFDINQESFDSMEVLNRKMENLKQNPLETSFFIKNLKKYLFNNQSFNELLNYGIPNNFREFVWRLVISEKYNNHKFFNYKEEQKNYSFILKNAKNNTQIEKDLNRTFINVDQKEKNLKKLRNVLNCINKYNNGYCQGMNYIAGFLLKITNFDEVETFYILKNILKDTKGYFENGFPLLKKNIYLFDLYFKKLYPKLYNHFQKYEIMYDFWIGKWFQTLFALQFPFEELSCIWDILLVKGFDYIIYISLAIIDIFEKKLLKLEDTSEILNFFENMINPKETIPIKKIQFEEYNYNIILLNKIFSKASKIKENIKENNINQEKIKINNNNINKEGFYLKNEKNNIDSTSTIETEKSLNTTYPISSKNSFSSSHSMNILNNSINSNKNLVNKSRNPINIKSMFYPLKKASTNNMIKMNNFQNINTNNYKYNNNTQMFYHNSYGFQLNKNKCFDNIIKYNSIDINPQYGNYLIYYA